MIRLAVAFPLKIVVKLKKTRVDQEIIIPRLAGKRCFEPSPPLYRNMGLGSSKNIVKIIPSRNPQSDRSRDHSFVRGPRIEGSSFCVAIGDSTFIPMTLP